jgi:hypothetical protein
MTPDSPMLVTFDRRLKGSAFISSYVCRIPNLCPHPAPRLDQSVEINGNRIELQNFMSKRPTIFISHLILLALLIRTILGETYRSHGPSSTFSNTMMMMIMKIMKMNRARLAANAALVADITNAINILM